MERRARPARRAAAARRLRPATRARAPPRACCRSPLRNGGFFACPVLLSLHLIRAWRGHRGVDIAPQMCSYGAALLLRRAPSPACVHAVSAGVGLCAFEEGLDVESVERGRCPGVGAARTWNEAIHCTPEGWLWGWPTLGQPPRHLCLASYFVARHHSLPFASLSCLLGQPDDALVVRAV